MLVTGEMDARPHDQDRQRCPGSTTGEQQLWKEGYARGVSIYLMKCVLVTSAVGLLGAGMLIEAGMF